MIGVLSRARVVAADVLPPARRRRHTNSVRSRLHPGASDRCRSVKHQEKRISPSNPGPSPSSSVRLPATRSSASPAVLGLASTRERLLPSDVGARRASRACTPRGEGPAELQDVSVRPEHRRRGVASASTASAERQARERGCNRWRLQVSAGNEGAQALCRRSHRSTTAFPQDACRERS